MHKRKCMTTKSRKTPNNNCSLSNGIPVYEERRQGYVRPSLDPRGSAMTRPMSVRAAGPQSFGHMGRSILLDIPSLMTPPNYLGASKILYRPVRTIHPMVTVRNRLFSYIVRLALQSYHSLNLFCYFS